MVEEGRAARFRFPITPLTTTVIRRLSERRAGAGRERADTLFGTTSRWETHDGADVIVFDPPGSETDDYAVYLHGGGFIFGSPNDTTGRLASSALRMPVLGIRYDLAPQAPFPRAIDQTTATWRSVTAGRSGRPVLVGVSAGGTLALGVLQKLLHSDRTEIMPSAVVLISPCTDLGPADGRRQANEGRDPILRWSGQMDKAIRAYVADADVKDPLVSPVHASWSGYDVPTLLTTGTRDLLLSDTQRLHRSMRAAGAPATLDVATGLWHGYQTHANLPEADAGWKRIAAFVAESGSASY